MLTDRTARLFVGCKEMHVSGVPRAGHKGFQNSSEFAACASLQLQFMNHELDELKVKLPVAAASHIKQDSSFLPFLSWLESCPSETRVLKNSAFPAWRRFRSIWLILRACVCPSFYWGALFFWYFCSSGIGISMYDESGMYRY